jgi:hypothetical protein
MMDGSLDEWRVNVPEEFRAQFDGWQQEIEAELAAAAAEVETWFNLAPTQDRKGFALWVQSDCPEGLAPLLYKRLGGHDLYPALYKKLLKTPVAPAIGNPTKP